MSFVKRNFYIYILNVEYNLNELNNFQSIINKIIIIHTNIK